MDINQFNLNKFSFFNKKEQHSFLYKINLELMKLTALQRIKWGLQSLPKTIILSSSFGIQSIVSLHLLTSEYPDIPIILIDTGYLFPETYFFIDSLTAKFKLNLHIFRPIRSPAWQEVKYGRLWKQGIQGIKFYNYINKVEPMQRALKEFQVSTWIAGLRRQQSYTRKGLMILSIQRGVFKFLPVVDWNNHQVYRYMQNYNLIHHPLFKKGYLSVGDVHTTAQWKYGINEELTRFNGLIRECGLHI